MKMPFLVLGLEETLISVINLGGRLSTEVAFALLTQTPWVQI